MSNQVKVSVICNVFNHGAYVRDALEGFVSQKTDFPFEVLVHDDASTDNSQEIIREYEQKYPHIIKPIYQTQNQYSQRISVTRTFQVPRIRGKYVALCEGDDYWTDPLKLQKQYDFMESHPDYAMCACSTVWLDMATGTEKNLCRVDTDREIPLEEIVLETKGRPFQYATFFVLKEVFCTYPDWRSRFGVGDTPLALQAAVTGKVWMLADTMAVYRNQAPGSWTSRISANTSYKVASFQKMIVGFTAFNEATDRQYDAVVSLRIKRLQYFIARASRDLKTMLSGELRPVFTSRSLPAKLSDLLLCVAPGIHGALLRWIKH